MHLFKKTGTCKYMSPQRNGLEKLFLIAYIELQGIILKIV